MARNRDAIHILRGKTEKIGSTIPEAGQPLYDKIKNILYIGDGTNSPVNTSNPDEALKAITVDDLAITTYKIKDEAVTLAKVNTTDTKDKGLSYKFVNRDTEQVISGIKHFNKAITVGDPDGNGNYNTGYSTILAKEYLKFGSGGKTATIASSIAGSSPSSRVFILPQTGGTLALFSDIPVDYVSKASSSSQTLKSGLQIGAAANDRMYLTKDYIQIVSSNTSTRYGDGSITVNSNSITLPNKAGTFALTSDLPTNYVNTTSNQTGIAGNKTFTGNITANVFYATSDRRLKENIVDYKPEKSILDIPVKEYNFIGDDKKHIGFIAQDLQEIFPELVTERADGYLSIEESKLIYLLIDEVKKLKEKVGD